MILPMIELMNASGRGISRASIPLLMLAGFGSPAWAGAEAEVAAATYDLYAKMNAKDLPGISHYISPTGFSEFTPEAEKLLQLDAKAFESLFKSGKQIDFIVKDVQVQAFGSSAIVTGIRLGAVTAANAMPVAGKLRFTMVWSRLGGDWQLSHVHLSSPAQDK